MLLWESAAEKQCRANGHGLYNLVLPATADKAGSGGAPIHTSSIHLPYLITYLSLHMCNTQEATRDILQGLLEPNKRKICNGAEIAQLDHARAQTKRSARL